MQGFRKPLLLVLVAVVVLVIISAYLKLIHAPVSHFFLDFTLIFFAIFLVVSLIAINRSVDLTTFEKWIYGFGVIFFFPLGIALFLLSTEKRRLSVSDRIRE